MSKARLIRDLRDELDRLAPEIAAMVGLPERRFKMNWAPYGTAVAAYTYAEPGLIYLSRRWFASHPDDHGCLTHEYTHLIQNVPGGTCPGEIVEGFADSVRYLLGLYDPAWWTPSPIAARIATLERADYQRLSRDMAAGRYSSFVWP